MERYSEKEEVLDTLGQPSPQLLGQPSPQLLGQQSPQLLGQQSPQLLGQQSPQLLGQPSPQHGECDPMKRGMAGADIQKLILTEASKMKDNFTCAQMKNVLKFKHDFADDMMDDVSGHLKCLELQDKLGKDKNKLYFYKKTTFQKICDTSVVWLFTLLVAAVAFVIYRRQ